MQQIPQGTLEGLREQLLKTKSWPIKYMFKFIVPNSGGRVERVIATLPEGGTNSFKTSKDLHYVAVTCVALMQSPDEIVEITRCATEVEGVISL